MDEFHAYDIYQPISNAADSFACDFDEAKVKVTAALSPSGYDYRPPYKRVSINSGSIFTKTKVNEAELIHGESTEYILMFC